MDDVHKPQSENPQNNTPNWMAIATKYVKQKEQSSLMIMMVTESKNGSFLAL